MWAPALMRLLRGAGRQGYAHLCLPVACNMSYGKNLAATPCAVQAPPVESAGIFRVAATNSMQGVQDVQLLSGARSARFQKKSYSRSQLHRLLRHDLRLSGMAE